MKKILTYLIAFFFCGCVEKITKITTNENEEYFHIIKHACEHLSDTGKIIIGDTTIPGTFLNLSELEHTKINAILIQKNNMWYGNFYFNSEDKNKIFIMCDKDVQVSLVNYSNNKEIAPQKIFDSKQIADSIECNSIKKVIQFETIIGTNIISIGPANVGYISLIIEEVNDDEEHYH